MNLTQGTSREQIDPADVGALRAAGANGRVTSTAAFSRRAI